MGTSVAASCVVLHDDAWVAHSAVYRVVTPVAAGEWRESAASLRLTE